MNETMVSMFPDSDMQAAPKALLLAAQRARDIARQTNTPLVLIRDGVLVEEFVTEARAAEKGHGTTKLPGCFSLFCQNLPWPPDTAGTMLTIQSPGLNRSLMFWLAE